MDISFLQILLYFLGAVFLICLIVLTIKVIYTINRVNFLLDNIERKMTVFDKAFNTVSKLVDTVSFAGDKIANSITGIISKKFKKKEREDD